MATKTGRLRRKDKSIPTLNNDERALLSIILMNKGTITGTKLKRIYLDKYSYWEMQSTEKRLQERGLLFKRREKESGEELEYAVQKESISHLSKMFLFKGLTPVKKGQIEPISSTLCGEYSALWYLWHLDSDLNYNILFKSRLTKNKASERKVEERFYMEGENVRFLINLLKNPSITKFLKENRYEKWSDLIASPHTVIKELFNTTKYSLREDDVLGREDVGKDNIDFFFEELSALKIEMWYPLRAFVSNSRSTLFVCNQPFRWIHFNEENVWNILHQKLRMIGVVETATGKDKERFLRLTTLGGYCIGRISEKKLIKTLSSRRGKIMIHPNFEVTVVSKELDPKAILNLAFFSEPVKSDTVSIFRITKESVREGRRLGLSTADMISFLKENSKCEIPQNVEYSIGDWGS